MHSLCTPCALRMHAACTLHELCIHSASTLHSLCIHSQFTLHPLCIHSASTLYTSISTLLLFRIHSTSTLHPLCIYSVSTLHPLCTHSASTPHSLVIHSASTLHPLCIHSSYTPHPLCIHSVYILYPVYIHSVSTPEKKIASIILKLMPDHYLLLCYSLYFAPFGFYRVLHTDRQRIDSHNYRANPSSSWFACLLASLAGLSNKRKSGRHDSRDRGRSQLGNMGRPVILADGAARSSSRTTGILRV